ncbi:MAG: class I SAM-dependent methyltransferase [Nitrospira sp.]|nr:class I SAM-dependent methyltransferase [Nitrospira sp.]
MDWSAYKAYWEKYLQETASTGTLLTNDPKRMKGCHAYATLATLLRFVEIEHLRDMRVVDFGCGTGRLARLIAPFCRQLILVDVSVEALQECQKRFGHLSNVEYRLVQGSNWVIPDKVDYVYSYASLIYICDADAFWRTVEGIDTGADAFAIHLHSTIDEAPYMAAYPDIGRELHKVKGYRPSQETILNRYSSAPSGRYLVEWHEPDVRGKDPFFYKTGQALSGITSGNEPFPLCTRERLDRFLCKEAERWYAAGDFTRACDLLLELAGAGTESWEIYNNLGVIAFDRSDVELAITCLEAAVSRGYPAEAMNNLETVLRSIGREPEGQLVAKLQ